ncbi:OLC1v1036926C1, partial [Oldenlandia corymbosa var. corymbosa]
AAEKTIMESVSVPVARSEEGLSKDQIVRIEMKAVPIAAFGAESILLPESSHAKNVIFRGRKCITFCFRLNRPLAMHFTRKIIFQNQLDRFQK